MHIVFADGTGVDIHLTPSPILVPIQRIYKHLQHVLLPFRSWDDPAYPHSMQYPELVNCLHTYAGKVGIQVDRQRCLHNEQAYFNELHKLYETGYNGNPDWLDFHEHIHMCEQYVKDKKPMMSLDYREKSGLLEQKFKPEWTEAMVSVLHPGDVYVPWAELGKSPYDYWADREPSDLSRLCELAKPWLKLKPKICVAFEHIDKMQNVCVNEFNAWWAHYETPWCSHWNIESWSVKDMHASTLIGHTDHIVIKNKLAQKIYPVKVILK